MSGIVLRMLPPDTFTGLPSLTHDNPLTDGTRKRYYILVDGNLVGAAELGNDQSVNELRLPLMRCPETATLVRQLSSLELADYEGRNTLRLGTRAQAFQPYLTLAVSDRNDSRSTYLVEKTVSSEGLLSVTIGRSPSNDIVFMDRCVSRNHAVLRWRREEGTGAMLAPTVEPLSTSSATWVQIPALAELPLKVGMQLRLGSESTECRIIRADSECLEFHMPADTVLETPDNSCLPVEMVYGESVTKIKYARRGLNNLTIGRSRSNALVVHADRGVSSFHCQISTTAHGSREDTRNLSNEWYLTDLGGTGTAICLPPGADAEHSLFNNDVLFIGNKSIKVQLSYHP